jgi:glycosyltransferase involved in cell wall biosynthesis
MKILLLTDRIPPENRGGAGEVVWRVAQHLHHAGQHITVIAATAGKPFEGIRAGIPTIHLHSHYPDRYRAYLSLYNPQTVGALKNLYQQLQPDIVHAHNIHTDLSYFSLTLAHQLKIPTVFTSHDVMPFAYHKLSHFIRPETSDTAPHEYRLPFGYNLRQMRLRYNPVRNLAIRHILTQHVRVRLAPSQALCTAHAANDLPPFECLHNGLDSADFGTSDAAIAALQDRLQLHGRKIILFAGRLTAAKGTVPLLQALNQVVQRVPEALLLVLSSQPIETQMPAEFAHLQAQHIRSGGWLAGQDLTAAFHVADMVVVPSIIFDTFPTVNLEAMAAGKPVLATCYGGSREIVQDGSTGYIINPFATADFAAKITRLLHDTALCRQMGAAGQARLQTHFSMQQHSQTLLHHYERARQLDH